MHKERTTIVSAPGKIILFGEHSVVYGQPAIALPVHKVKATCTIRYEDHPGVLIVLPDLGQDIFLHEAPVWHPHAAAIRLFVQRAPDITDELNGLRVELKSTIPIGRGLGSGAALAAALLRALSQHFDRPELSTDAVISEMTFEIEKLHHGTPSGIDNTVVSFEKPIYYVRDMFTSDRKTYEALLGHEGYYLFMPALVPFRVKEPFTILIADTGITALTKEAVGEVRAEWSNNRLLYETYFMRSGEIATDALEAIQAGDIGKIGSLMNFNHRVLRMLNVSSVELDYLVEASVDAGAIGAKMSGGGRGGNMIALINEHSRDAVIGALFQAGAKSIIETHVGQAS